MASNRNRKLVLQIVGDLDDAKKSLRGLDRNVSALTTGLAGLAGAISVREIVDFAFGAAEAASNLQALEATTERLLPTQSSLIDELVETNRQFGLSRSASRENINAFLALGDAVGFSEDQLVGLSGDLNTLVLDIAAARDADPAQVFNAFNSALVGNTETLRQFVPTISAANIEAAALAATGKASAKELTAADKALGLLNLTAKDTEAFVGAAADEQDQFATQVSVARAALEDMRAEIGEAFIPIFSDLLGRFIDFDTEAFVGEVTEAVEVLGEVIDTGVGVVENIGEIREALSFGGEGSDWLDPFRDLQGLLETVEATTGAIAALVNNDFRSAWEQTLIAVQGWINGLIASIDLILPFFDLPRVNFVGGGQATRSLTPSVAYTPPAPSTYSETNVTVTGVVGDPFETGREIARAINTVAPGTVAVD